VITRKVKAAVTDSGRRVAYDWGEKPGISNLLEIFALCSGRTVDELASQFADSGYGPFKAAVARAVVDRLTPIRTRFKAMTDDEVGHVMARAALDARARTEGTMVAVRRAVGLSGN
jgi:tryptophanyl-tRNA synthetase